MSLSGNNSNIDEAASQSEEIVPITEVFVKEERCEIDDLFPIESDMNCHTNEAADYHTNEEKLGVTGFVSNDSTVLFNKYKNVSEEMAQLPNVSSIKRECESNTQDSFHKDEKCEMEICSDNKFEYKLELEELSPDEIDIKDENEAESKPLCSNQHQMKRLREKPFSCDQCDYVTFYSSNLKKHQWKHSGEKPLACNLCGYKTASASHLKQHKMTHSGEKPYACDVCDYKTTNSGRLKGHQMKHSGEKPFVCHWCDYKTTSASYLKVHQTRHTGEKPFACNVCDYKTVNSHHLKQHQMKHSGEKPFVCGLCDYKTTSSTHLKQHQTVHSQEKPFSCGLCDYKTASLVYLKRHQKKHHPEEK